MAKDKTTGFDMLLNLGGKKIGLVTSVNFHPIDVLEQAASKEHGTPPIAGAFHTSGLFTASGQLEEGLNDLKEFLDNLPPLQGYEVLVTESGKVIYGPPFPSKAENPLVFGGWLDENNKYKERLFACFSHHHTEAQALKAAVQESGVAATEYVKVEE